MCSQAWASIMPLFSAPSLGGRKVVGDEVREGVDRESRGGGRRGSGPLSCTPSDIFALLSIVFSPSSEPCHEIPHMPLIWNEAAQEWTYLTAVEFSTFASNVSPEAIRQKEEWAVLSDWERTQHPLLFVQAAVYRKVWASGKMEG